MGRHTQKEVVPKKKTFVLIEKAQRRQKSNVFLVFFAIFSKYLAPSGAKYCEKGLAAIGKSFGKGLGRFWKKLNFQAVIKSAASAASLDLQGSPRTTARHADGGTRGLPRKSVLDDGELQNCLPHHTF